jgi:hypothetical protein
MSFKSWLGEQIEWLKDFFEETKGGKSSSRRIIEIAVVWVFLASYLKVSIATSTIQDVPWGWGILIAGILGLKTLDAFVKNKNIANGNGDTLEIKKNEKENAV